MIPGQRNFYKHFLLIRKKCRIDKNVLTEQLVSNTIQTLYGERYYHAARICQHTPLRIRSQHQTGGDNVNAATKENVV